MSHAKQASKRRRRNKAIPVFGAAGLSLSLVSGASAAVGALAADTPTRNAGAGHEITLAEEDISGVSLATFYVFDKDNAANLRVRLRQSAAGCGCGCGCGGCGCGGCGCWTGTYYTSSVVGGNPPPPARHHAVRPAHKHKRTPAHVPKKS